jgi:hypothetical protein
MFQLFLLDSYITGAVQSSLDRIKKSKQGFERKEREENLLTPQSSRRTHMGTSGARRTHTGMGTSGL